MSAIKNFAELVSVEMGLGGEINDAVLAEAQRRLDDMQRRGRTARMQRGQLDLGNTYLIIHPAKPHFSRLVFVDQTFGSPRGKYAGNILNPDGSPTGERTTFNVSVYLACLVRWKQRRSGREGVHRGRANV